MEMRSTLTASLRAHAGAARTGGAAHLAHASAGTGQTCSSAYAWQLVDTKPAIPVFNDTRPARRLWEVSP